MWFLSQRSWLVGAALLATGAQAAGYEKVVTWSGKYVGIGGAAASSVQGSESLYFNPAGLASGSDKKWDASLNFSPTFAKFSGPVIKNGDVKQGNWKLLPIVGATVAYNVDSKWTVATGYYVSGGAQAEYTGINPSDLAATYDVIGAQTVKTDLKILEWSIGGSYKLDEHWSFGAAWRASFVSAAFSTYVLDTPSVVKYFDLHDLSAKKWNGFRLGIQYRGDDNKWGLGLAFRSAAGFTAAGKASGKVETAAVGQGADIPEVDATVSNTFPMQIGFGGDFTCGEHWRLFSEYTWTQYSKNQQIDFTGTITTAITGSVDLATQPLKQRWMDQHNIRLAGEYTGFATLPIRFAYVLTSQVVPKSTAKASFPAPGLGHTFTLGSGYDLGRVSLNGALEYSFETATVAAGEGVTGDYNVKAWGLHLGASMKF